MKLKSMVSRVMDRTFRRDLLDIDEESRASPGKHTDSEAVSAESLAGVILSISRVLAGVAALSAFKSDSLRLGEWLALSLIVGAKATNGISAKKLGRAMGVNAQRMGLIVTSLEESRLVERVVDGHTRIIRPSEDGEIRLTALNSEIEAELAAGNVSSVARVAKMLRLLDRSLSPKDPARIKAKVKIAKG